MNMFHNSNERCIKSITAAHNILLETLRSYDIIKKPERIAVALLTLDLVLNSNRELAYSQRDVLSAEVYYLQKRKIPYIDGMTGELMEVTFNEALCMQETVIFKNPSLKERKLPATYIKGNMAIGQVFIDGEEGYCTKLAVEHSLKTIAKKWFRESNVLLSIFQTK